MGSQRVGHDWSTELNWTERTTNLNRIAKQICSRMFRKLKFFRPHVTISSFLFIHSVMSGTLWPQGLQDIRPLIHHILTEFTQSYVHWIGEVIQPAHPLSSPLPPAFNLSQHQRLFQWVSSSHQVAKVSASASVLTMNIQDWFALGLMVGSPCCPRDSQESLKELCLQSNSHIHTWPLEKP